MLVPAAVEDLHDPHAALDQPAGQQGAVRRTSRASCTSGPYRSSVSCGSFDRSVSSGTLRLHAERHLVLRDAGLRLGVAVARRRSRWLSLPSVSSMARRSVVADAVGVLHVEDRVAGAAQGDAAVLAGQEAAAPTSA